MKKIALLIDLENISPAIIDRVFQLLEPMGKVTIKRAYGDFSLASSQLAAWKPICLKHNIEMIHHFACKPHKNSSDILLAIDAMDMLHQTPVELFCLVSSDSDFSSLIQRLKRNQCDVIGVGISSPNENYALLFEQFYQLDPNQPIVEAESDNVDIAKVSEPKTLPLVQRCKQILSRLFQRKPKPPAINRENDQPRVVAAPSLNREQQLIQSTYKRTAKDAAGYVTQSRFAANLTEGD